MTPHPMPAPKPKSSTLVVLLAIGAVLLVGCCGIGTLAAIAIPNFIRYQARARQAECKANLRNLFAAQRAAFGRGGHFERDFEALGFRQPGRRYTYFMGSGAELAPDRPGVAAISASALPPIAGGQPPGVVGSCPSCSFVAVCAANLDGDGTFDVWSISSDERLVGATTVPAGEPYNDVNDISE